MASTSSALTISSSSTLHDCKAPRQSPAASPQCVSLPPPPLHSQNRSWKTTAYCKSLTKHFKVLTHALCPTLTSDAAKIVYLTEIQHLLHKLVFGKHFKLILELILVIVAFQVAVLLEMLWQWPRERHQLKLPRLRCQRLSRLFKKL